MERKKHFLTAIFLIFTLAGASQVKSDIYNAYISGKMENWKATIDQLQNTGDKSLASIAALVNYQYGYIGWCIGTENEKEAKTYLKKAEEILEILENEGFDQSFLHAYKAAFYGFKIGFSPLRAPFYGPKSVNNAERAIELDKTNPMGYVQMGNSQYYMPAAFGGSKKKALDYYTSALELMEQQGDTISNWNYLSLLTCVAEALGETGKYEEAEIYFQKILKKEPGFTYIKNELYPAFLKERKQNE